mmetsp:Transcript_57929/g.163560  ORF Transcript_57929/g.163560 Transcript_57929/m.163560 type:complete len:208 (-) Transcript_57929:44-667(-)
MYTPREHVRDHDRIVEEQDHAHDVDGRAPYRPGVHGEVAHAHQVAHVALHRAVRGHRSEGRRARVGVREPLRVDAAVLPARSDEGVRASGGGRQIPHTAVCWGYPIVVQVVIFRAGLGHAVQVGGLRLAAGERVPHDVVGLLVGRRRLHPDDIMDGVHHLLDPPLPRRDYLDLPFQSHQELVQQNRIGATFKAICSWLGRAGPHHPK